MVLLVRKHTRSCAWRQVLPGFEQGMCKVGRGRLKPLQSQAFTQNNRQVSESKRRERLRQLPEAALRRLESSLRRQAWGVGCCDLSRPTSCQATLHMPWDSKKYDFDKFLNSGL